MKKIFLFIFLIILLIIPLLNPAYASTGSEIIQRVDSDTKEMNSLWNSIKNINNSDSQAILNTLDTNIPSVVQHLDESLSFYQSKINEETDPNLKTIIEGINENIQNLRSDFSQIKQAIDTQDKDSYSTALKNYDTHIAALNTYIDKLNSNQGVVDYSWLLWPFLISILISVVLFIMSRGNPILPAEQLRNQFKFELFKSSLWPLFGSGISYVGYLNTPAGGTFYVLWGPIFIGFFVFFKGLYAYITVARPAINLAKNEQQAKLQELISSKKFETENIAEEYKDIEKLSTEKKKCGNCNKYNSISAKFCKSCGNKF